MFKRQFLVRKGKEIRATDVGRQLITTLPKQMVIPYMTAHWESQLEAISQREMKYSDFMNPLTDRLNQLLNDVQQVSFIGLNGKGRVTVKYNKKQKVYKK